MNDDGFTLTEALVALLVLSFAMIAIGDLSFGFIRAFRISLEDISEADRMIHVVRRSDLPEGDAPNEDGAVSASLEIDGRTFHLRFPVGDLQDNCLYDVVGRRCR